MADIALYEVYFNSIDNPTLMDFILYKCYKLNSKGILKNRLNKIIFYLEKKKYGEHKEKLIEHQDIDIQTLTNKGFRSSYDFWRTKPYNIYILKLDNGYELKCADNHLVYAQDDQFNDEWVMVKDLDSTYQVYTDSGWASIVSIESTDEQQYMCDMTIASSQHAYYTGGILSHNTTTTVCYLLHTLIFHEEKSCLVIANKARTGKEIVKKMKEVLEDLPYFMKPGIVNLSEERIAFENGSYIITAAASKAPATGDSLNLLYIDEAALIPANIIDEYWASVYPTLSSFRGSQIIMSSTPRGKQNLFYKFYNGAVTGELLGWKHSRTDWWEVPEHDEQWLAQMKQDLGEELFKREVELSFDTTDSLLVSHRSIRFMERLCREFVPKEFYDVPESISQNILWDPDFNPNYLTYNDLMNRRFLLMIDTAQGIENSVMGKKDSDYNVINIYEIQPMSPHKIEENRHNQPISTKDVIQYKQVGVYMDNMKNEEKCAEAAKYIVFNILKSGFNDIDNTRIMVEMNFQGNNWVTKFQNHPMFYNALLLKTFRTSSSQKTAANAKDKPKALIGYVTKAGSRGKNYYCELGAEMIDKRQIIIMQKHDDINKSTFGEISQFCKKQNKNTYAGQGCHDDLASSTLFISIVQEASGFTQWINDWLESIAYIPKVQRILYMLEIYVEKEVQLNDEQFKDFYSMASQGFKTLTHKQNGYGSIMRQSMMQPSSPYGGTFSKFNNYR